MTGADGDEFRLLEVAVALPVSGTFTYRDPRPGAALGAGTQVVVPFGGRIVTGFVLGPAAPSPGGAIRPRDIDAVVGGEPAFDEEILGLCRWAAAYYQAPLGELLRAGLPQGERAESVRLVRITPEGERAVRGDGAGSQISLGGVDAGGGDVSPVLRTLSDAGGEMTWRAIAKRFGRSTGQISRLEAAGLVEVGDQVQDRRRPPTEEIVVATGGGSGAATLSPRARTRRAVLEKISGVAAGVLLGELSAGERAHARALAAMGLARIDTRPAPLHGRGAGAPAARPSETPPHPTPAQADAIATLSAALGRGYATFLLQGVTGSGKTEVYLRVIAQARAAGRGALVLVPEIALTPQLAARFRARFGDDVAVLHSGLPPRERLAAWRRLRAGEVGIAVGARSAVFAPVRALGIVVVDEEHDSSFKQEEGVRYHGRDLAVVRAQRAGAVAVLGSATPSLESRRNAELGRFARLLLPQRATPRPLPPVEIVDLRRHPPGPEGLLSASLAEAVAANLAAGQQTILFSEPARFLDRRAVPRVWSCSALRPLRGVDDVSPRARSAGLSLLWDPGVAASRLSRLSLAAARTIGHGNGTRRGADAGEISRRARGPAGSRHRGRRRRGAWWRAGSIGTGAAGNERRGDRHPGRDTDGDQGSRFRRRDVGRRVAARPSHEPPGFSRR